MSTGAEISFGTTVHGLPASTDAEFTFGTSAHGLPAYSPGIQDNNRNCVN